MSSSEREGAGVGRKQNRRIVVNVTEEQFEAVQEALRIAIAANGGEATKNELLGLALKHMCRNLNVEWPEFEPTTEGRNFKKGKGGKFVKKS